ncbi:hypothetical protein RUND412_003154 [Rhizina undulata]
MDHKSMGIYIHWLQQVGKKAHFHSKEIACYWLKSLEGLKAAKDAAANILDWGLTNRLPKICKYLDVIVAKTKIAATTQIAEQLEQAQVLVDIEREKSAYSSENQPTLGSMPPPPPPQNPKRRRVDEPGTETMQAPGTNKLASMMTLFCWVFGDAQSFPVEISREKIIGQLKKAIIAEVPDRFRGIGAVQLILWQAEILDNDEALWNFDFKNAKELRLSRKIFKEFKDDPLEDHIHIVIKTPGK